MLYGDSIHIYDMDCGELRDKAWEVSVMVDEFGFDYMHNVLDGDTIYSKYHGPSQEAEDKANARLASLTGYGLDGEPWEEDQSVEIY